MFRYLLFKLLRLISLLSYRKREIYLLCKRYIKWDVWRYPRIEDTPDLKHKRNYATMQNKEKLRVATICMLFSSSSKFNLRRFLIVQEIFSVFLRNCCSVLLDVSIRYYWEQPYCVRRIKSSLIHIKFNLQPVQLTVVWENSGTQVL